MILGIDIGTHNAHAAWVDEAGIVRPVIFRDGPHFSALARQTMHGLLLGEAAADAQVGNAETTLVGCTRLMCRPADLSAAQRARLPFAVREAGGDLLCDLLYAEAQPAQVYGQIVRALVAASLPTLGDVQIALAVPASADDRFRVLARAACTAQGISVARICSAPAAALRAAAIPGQPRTVLILHLGDAVAEATLAQRSAAGWQIVATTHNDAIGGDDMAWHAAAQLNTRFAASGCDVFAADDGRLAAQGLRAAAEDALRTLAAAAQTTLTLDHGGGFGRDLVAHVTRAEADAWLTPALRQLTDLMRSACQRVVPDAVLLIGSWAWLPQLPATICTALHVSPRQVTLASADLVARGAALLARDPHPLVWDVTPYALGIDCHYDGIALLSTIIAPNTPIPTTGKPGAHTESFQTLFPNQTSVTLRVLQYRGNRNPLPAATAQILPDECETLGTWQFSGLKPKRGGHAAFTVTFAVDADGVLALSARETATGRTLQARVERTIG